MGRRLDWRSVRLHRGYEDFATGGSNSVQQALTTVQRDAIATDELRAGDRIWNLTTTTLQVWTGVSWVDVGGGGSGGHIGINGEDGTWPELQDHTLNNTSWMWEYQVIDTETTDYADGAPEWISNIVGVSEPVPVSPLGSCRTNILSGGIKPTGLDPANWEPQYQDDFIDCGIARNITINPTSTTPYCPQYLMVKGLSFTTDQLVWDPSVFNVVVGFANSPFQGFWSALSPWPNGFNLGLFFVAAKDLRLDGTPAQPYPEALNGTDNPLGENWYACTCVHDYIYAVDTLIPIESGVKHKFFVEWHGDNRGMLGGLEAHALFYIDDALVATITESDATDGAKSAWPAMTYYEPCVGISNTTNPNFETLVMEDAGYVNYAEGDTAVYVAALLKIMATMRGYNNATKTWTVEPSYSSNIEGAQGTMAGQVLTTSSGGLPAAHLLIGRHVTINGVSYDISDNTTGAITVTGWAGGNISVDWVLPLEPGDVCSFIGDPGTGTIKNGDFIVVKLMPEFYLPFIHAARNTADIPLPPI